MPTITGRHYATHDPISLSHEHGVIVDIHRLPSEANHNDVWIAPALVDLQINGIAGHEFLDQGLSQDDLHEMCEAIVATGVRSFLPTITTESFERLDESLRNLANFAAMDSTYARCIGGFHVEGPYISSEDGPRGAHPRTHCRPPCWDEFQRFQEAADGRIKVLTMSPEYDNAVAFIERAVEAGVSIAIGHTAADSSQIDAAVSAGASFSTHLGNGAHATIRRHPNYIWDQLADDRISATIIADGHHLPPSLLKCFYRCKPGKRLVLVSDMTGMAGMPVGIHTSDSLGNVEVLEDGRLVVAGQRQYLAGAARPLWDGIKNMTRYTAADLGEAIDMAAHRPATLIEQPSHELTPGAPADFLLIEKAHPQSGETYRLKEVVWGGMTTARSGLILDRMS